MSSAHYMTSTLLFSQILGLSVYLTLAKNIKHCLIALLIKVLLAVHSQLKVPHAATTAWRSKLPIIFLVFFLE